MFEKNKHYWKLLLLGICRWKEVESVWVMSIPLLDEKTQRKGAAINSNEEEKGIIMTGRMHW